MGPVPAAGHVGCFGGHAGRQGRKKEKMGELVRLGAELEVVERALRRVVGKVAVHDGR